jgi:4-diphosphocytidyl-2-C-methyl-D-erythritol kinase
MRTSFPYAKINIGLYVVERRADGYHNLQTVFYPIPLHDNLEISQLNEEEGPYRLQIAGNAIEGNADDNLVIKVYNHLKKDFDLPPIDIYIYKRIPTGAGLGGGSSDAAAMMRALNEKFQLGMTADEMEKRIAGLGADCPFFIQSIPAYAEGIGDQLQPIAVSLKGWTLLLIKPDIFVSTKEAYGGVCPQQPQHDLRMALQQPIENWKNTISNDFERSVFLHHPEIAAIKQTLYDMGATYASMSGSGSTVFGLFKHPIDEAPEIFKNCFVYQETLKI